MAYKSLMKDDDLIKGDSSDINMFSTDMADDLSVNWSASYTIAENLGDALPIVARDLPLNDGSDGEPANKYFVHQITPTESGSLTAGNKYWVTIQITNDVIGFNAEVAQYKLKIKEQGVL